jgi:tetratricopeptide (TPR) repeat protein
MKKVNNEKLNRTYSLSFIPCFALLSFLALCLPVSVADAETSPEQFDPMDFLTGYSVETSQNDNEPNVPMQTAKPRQDRQEQQPQTGEFVPLNFGAQVDKKLSQDDLISQANSDNRTAHQSWRANISTLRDQEDKTGKDELRRIIEQIRSIQFKPRGKSPEPAATIGPAPASEPNEITSNDTKTPEKPQEKAREPKLPYEPVSSETLQTLEELSRHPDQLGNPFELGEVLFLSGHLKQAEVFYREALGRSSTDDAGSAQDRDWILFQIANCLREDKPPEAAKLYRQLIAEYPDSPWIELAKAQEKLIDWYQKDKPWTLIAENQQSADSRQ